MRKIFFLSLFISHVTLGLFGQVYGEKDVFTPKIVTPNVGNFQTFNSTEVNTYQGTANVNIPLYNIEIGKISVPISISYLSSGVKADQVSSNIGLNWSLQAGGEVMKIIKGQEDFSIKYRLSASNVVTNIGWLLLNKEIVYQSSSYPADLIATDPSTNRDKSPDIFIANAPGLNSRFAHRFSGVVQEIDKKGHLIETTIGESDPINFFTDFYNPNFPSYLPDYYPGNKLQCISNIKIINTSGVQYVFKDLDVIQYIQRDAVNSRSPTDLNLLSTSQEVTSYNLSSIQDTEGNKVDFIYEQYQISTPEFQKSSISELQTDFTFQIKNIFSTEIRYPQLNRLKRIEYRNGSVEFDYTKSREDLQGDFALTQITIRDIHQKVIKTIKLTQSYFISNNECSEPTCKRLKLEEVIIEGRENLKSPPYRFFYNEAKLPERGSRYVDFMGYARDQIPSQFYGTSVVKNSEALYMLPPKIYFSPYKKRLSFSPFEIYSNSFVTSNSVSLSSNLNMAQAGILTSLEHPTGATEEFIYELNTFKAPEDEDIEIAGGGLRIKKTILTDTKNRITQKKYYYIDEQGKTSGYINNLPLYGSAQASGAGYDVKDGHVGGYISSGEISLKYFSTPTTNLQLTQGTFVGYSRVLIEENNNGYTEFIYTSPKDYPLIEPGSYPLVGLNPGDLEIQYAFDNGGFIPYHNDRDILMGKLVKSRIYDNNNTLLNERTTQYQYRVFETNIHPIKVWKSQITAYVPPHQDYSMEFMGEVYSHRNMMVLDEQKSFLDNSEVLETTKNWYHYTYPLIQRTQRTGSHSNESLITTYFYPFQSDKFTSDPTELNEYELLTNNNNIDNPVFIETISRKAGVNQNVILSKQQTLYNHGLPNEIKISKGNEPLKSNLLINRYDNFGNINSIKNPDGTTVCYIWGYNSSLPIAKVENMIYSQIPINLINAIQYASDLDDDNCTDSSCKEEQLRVALQNLRNSLPYAHITTYTYNPHIGITSVTDPKGDINYFLYDGLNRLEQSSDYKFNILSKNYYNYFKN